jgi:hypothetical protein
MMRKLTATGLATLALAGFAGTGAAFAATSHSAKPVAARDYKDGSSKDVRSSEQHAGKTDKSMDRSSKDASKSKDARGLESAR